MRNAVKVLVLAALSALAILLMTASSCGDSSSSSPTSQRNRSIETRAEMFARAEALYPVPQTINFPLRQVLVEYTTRADAVNHPWYTYIYNDLGQVTQYFVSTTVPVSVCAFLGSTEDVETRYEGTIILTAPSLDGIYYGGSGSSDACRGKIYIDAATGAMGIIDEPHTRSFDAPLILPDEPVRIIIENPDDQ